MSRFQIPVRCDGCGSIYDLCSAEVEQRYLDCTRWKAPCCGRQCDDRPRGWGGGGYMTLVEPERSLALAGAPLRDHLGRVSRNLLKDVQLVRDFNDE